MFFIIERVKMKSIIFFKFIFLFLITVFLFSSIELMAATKLAKNNFYKSITENDSILLATYVQGGKTKCKVKIKTDFTGKETGTIIIKGIDNEKLRQEINLEPLKPNRDYIFIVSKKDNSFILDPDSVIIPVMKDKAQFSLNTPYKPSFWHDLDINFMKILFTAIREKASATMLTTDTEIALQSIFEDKVDKKDFSTVRGILNLAALTSVRLNEEKYTSIISGNDLTACVALKHSTKIMGKDFFLTKIAPNLESYKGDSLIAATEAAIDSESTEVETQLEKLLQKIQTYNPSSSECFPEEKPMSNKAKMIQAIVEINSQDTRKILLRELSTNNPDWLEQVLLIMAQYEGEDLVDIVLTASSADSVTSQQRINFNNYFMAIKSKENAKYLEKRFETSSGIFQSKVILLIIGSYGYKDSLDFLIKVLNEDSKEEIRTAAAIALGSLKSAEAVEPLRNFITKETSILAKSIAIDSMAKIPSDKVQVALKEIIKNEQNSKIREDAAKALEDNLFILRYGESKEKYE